MRIFTFTLKTDNQSTERLSTLPRVTQLVKNGGWLTLRPVTSETHAFFFFFSHAIFLNPYPLRASPESCPCCLSSFCFPPVQHSQRYITIDSLFAILSTSDGKFLKTRALSGLPLYPRHPQAISDMPLMLITCF